VLGLSTAWRFVAADVAMRTWDEQTVAYHRRSGDTHCLDRVASALLARLAQAGTLDEAALGAAVESAASPEARDAAMTVANTLYELERIGLVQRLTS
jgi:PqqD family protein of HPr-rel-A system